MDAITANINARDKLTQAINKLLAQLAQHNKPEES